MDPVMQDLNRHLTEVDEAEARSEAVEEIIEDWLKDLNKVTEALVDELDVPPDLFAFIVEGYMTGNWGRAAGWIEDTLRQKFDEAAQKALDDKIAQDQNDAAEAAASRKEVYRDY